MSSDKHTYSYLTLILVLVNKKKHLDVELTHRLVMLLKHLIHKSDKSLTILFWVNSRESFLVLTQKPSLPQVLRLLTEVVLLKNVNDTKIVGSYRNVGSITLHNCTGCSAILYAARVQGGATSQPPVILSEPWDSYTLELCCFTEVGLCGLL